MDEYFRHESFVSNYTQLDRVFFALQNSTYMFDILPSNIRRGSFDEGATEYDEIERPVAYRRVLTTWSQWVENNIDVNHSKVFFTSMSPLHIK